MNKYNVTIEWWEERIYNCINTFKVIAKNEKQAKEVASAIQGQVSNDTCEFPREWTEQERKEYYEYLKDTIESEQLTTTVRRIK